MRLPAFALLVTLATSAFAADWTCRNTDMEISCTGGKCENVFPFTPMQIGIGSKGDLNICAYSDCWTGRGTVLRSGAIITVAAKGLVSSREGAVRDRRAIVVAIDTQDGIGVMKMGAFAQPLACGRMK